LPLNARQEGELIGGGYALKAEGDEETQALQTQLANLPYAGDDCPEMDLVMLESSVTLLA
jgi:hypothetical protein